MRPTSKRLPRKRWAAIIFSVVLLTLGAFFVNESALRQSLDLEVELAALAHERQAVETGLLALAATPDHPRRIATLKTSWKAFRERSSVLIQRLGSDDVAARVAAVDGRIERLANSTANPRLVDRTVAAELTRITGALEATAIERRADALDRYRLLTAITLTLLAVEGMLLFLPSLKRLARVESVAQEAEERLAYLAHHDELTGLANRRALDERLAELVQDEAITFGLVLCDLDGFKPINDVYGHDAGDTVLRAVARRLDNGLRPGDLAVRLGGDEFVLVVGDAVDHASLIAIAERLRERLAHPVPFGAHQLRFAASLGTALYPQDGTNPRTLVSAADAAMYEAKQAGGREVRSYSRQLRERDAMRHEIANELENAIADNALTIALQPRIELATGRMTGFEALTRWHSSHRGDVPPDVFIPMADSAGLLVPLAIWMLNELDRLMQGWTMSGLGPVHTSLNVASTGLLADDVLDALIALGPGRIGVEITDDAMFGRSSDAVVERLRVLHDADVRIAIDDFGQGSAPLGHLAAIPFDQLKIAGTFIRQLDREPGAAAIVRTTIELAQRLGGRAVATSVETQPQLDFLIDSGCDEGQGYLLAPPLSPDAASRYLANAKRAPQLLFDAALTDDT